MAEAQFSPISESDHARVAPTAWGVSYLRTFSDIPLSQEFFDVLNRNVQAQGEPDIATSSFRDYLAPQLEARYKLVDQLILAQGSTQVLELAAGVATHGINLTRAHDGLRYVELDLPVVVAQKEAILKDLGLDVPAQLAIVAGSALSEADIRRATSSFDPGESLTVVNEGLMRYLTFDEKAVLARTVHGLLTEFGGAWVTPDISLKQALSRENDVSSGHTERLKQTTGIDIDKNVFDDVEHAARFFGELGFSIERHSFLEVSNQLVSPARLGMTEEAVRQLNEPCVAFVMTVK